MKKRGKSAEKRMMFSIALPIMIQRLTHHLMLLIDRAFVGNLDSRYLSAIGNVMIPYNAMSFIFFAIATGLTVLVAQNIGRRDYHRAQQLSQSAFFYLTLISTGLSLLWFIGVETILSLFGATGDVLQFSAVYVRIIAVYMIFFGIEVAAASILEAVGTTRPIMVVGVIKSFLNIFLDWLLIFGHWGFPALGLQGAALATLIANLIGCAILFYCLFLQGNLPFSLEVKVLYKPEWQSFREIVRLGLPSGVEIFLYQLGNLVLVRFLNWIDEMAIGIYSLVTSLQTIPVLIYMGFAKATMTMVGQYWGEERFTDAKKIVLHAQKISVATCAVMGMIFALIPGTLIRVFTPDPEVLVRAAQLLRISGILLIFQSSNIVSGHAIRATGDTRWMLYSQIYGTAFVIGFSAFTLFYFEWGLPGLYLATILDELTRGIINFLRFFLGFNPLKMLPGLPKALVRRRSC